MKIIALANDPDSLEKLINDYFFSTGYELVLVKRVNEKNRKLDEIKYIIENKRLDQDKVIIMNLDYSVKYKKGKYYFYRNEESENKRRNRERT